MDRKQNVHYRNATHNTCITCRNRIFFNIHDPDGRLVGQDYRCPTIGTEYPVSDSHTCDKYRPVRQPGSIVEPQRMQW